MASSEDLLNDLLLQADANRALKQEQTEEQQAAAYANAAEALPTGQSYQLIGGSSVAQGTSLAANYDPNSGQVVFVETYAAGTPGTAFAGQVPCAAGVDCYDDNFCYGWYECGECEWCVNNQCFDRDPNRACLETWECPCAPNEDQHYECYETACRLTCTTNDQCGDCEICDPRLGYCAPGCTEDWMCDPTAAGCTADAQANTFCMDCECRFPCDPARFCRQDSDCLDGEYCGDRAYKLASDPPGALKQCLQGCRDDASCGDGETCDPDDRSCYRACQSDADCPDGEGCLTGGKCSTAGAICSSKSDCKSGEFCSRDGRCRSGCVTDSDCDEICEKVQSCVDECPASDTCTCEGDGCYNENWRELCPREPDCVDQCPDDPDCVRRQGSVCIQNDCKRICNDSSECLSDEVCVDFQCEVVTSSDQGQPDTTDDRLGCDCGDQCSQYGACEPVICKADSECPSCSICENGVCVPGCSDENPCPGNVCCMPDGRCAKACTSDLDCDSEPGNQLCLEGGCCGYICEPLVACVSRSDCGSGQYCGDEGYCLDGCTQDSDCATDDGLARCNKQYVRRPNGAWAPCDYYPDEECFSEVGRCDSYCISDSDCAEGDTCVDEQCQSPPEPTCVNDNDCEASTVCIDEKCVDGCRYDSQCPDSEICRDKKCEVACTYDLMCKVINGEASSCINGICATINDTTGTTTTPDSGEGGRAGCKCYEYCDKLGFCQPYVCDSDLDCEEEACGSCLVGNKCGACFSDADCPGTKKCDIKDVCDEDTAICQPDPEGGVCAYACVPNDVPGSCVSNDACPDGYHCEGGQCERGCIENDDCTPGQVCRSDRCVASCTTDSSCGTQERCVNGGCRYVGEPCDQNNNQARAIKTQIDRKNEEKEDLGDQIEVIRAPLMTNLDRNNLTNDLADKQTALQEAETDYQELQVQIQERQSKLDALKERSPKSASDEEDIAEQERILDGEFDRLENKQVDIADRKEEIANIQTRLATTQVEELTPEQQAQIDSLQEQVDQIEGELDTLNLQLKEAENQGCPSGKVCNTDQCEYPEPECQYDWECSYPATCVDGTCVEPPDADDYRAYEPEVIGCPSCAMVCDQGTCRDAPCTDNTDCPCGYCGPKGVCLEECRTDLDCVSGVCDQGSCLDCRTNGDCAKFGQGAICDGGKCQTPCLKSFSTGDCTKGLEQGDTCGACPDRCPAAAPCRRTEEVCGVREVYDPVAKTTRVSITYCEQCAHTCVSSSDCEDGTICGPYGICVQSDGRCSNDSDCAEDAMANGVTMVCRNNTCIEPGTTCISTGDCDTGEVCDDGKCMTGECSEEDPCQDGKTCVDNTCRWTCGSGAEVYLCGSNSPTCPPGMTCEMRNAYGGVCVRPGMTVDEVQEPGCPVGTLCCNGGCVPKTPDTQCCEDDDCPHSITKDADGNEVRTGDVCCEGKCKGSCDDKTANGNDDTKDKTEDEIDNCEAIGKCCGDDGWCEPCGCSEDNPCPSGQCCDKDSGVCVDLSEHPNTKYGAPLACVYDQTFCMLLGPEKSEKNDQGVAKLTRGEIVPEELGGPGFAGCEIIDAARQIQRCWPGGPKTADQIKVLLDHECFKPEKKQCNCPEIPSSDECTTNADCGNCARCVKRRYRNDACCSVYGEGEYETTLGYDGPAYTDYVERRVCEGDQEREGCGCYSSDDCTECEECVGENLEQGIIGQCQERCDSLCPCGGDLSGGKKCKTCEERYGGCAKGESVEITPSRINPTTGEEIPAVTGCSCTLQRTKKCCQGVLNLADLLKTPTKCERITRTYPDGTKALVQTETCLDITKDQCAECESDADCPGRASRCRNHLCMTECGGAQTTPSDNTGTDQGKGDVGGDPYSCWCCTKDGECRAKYESWMESREQEKGPFTIVYEDYKGVRRTWYSNETEYAAAVADIRAANNNQEPKIVKADGQTANGECRPCQCTDTGIDCKAWADCDGCYAWVKTGDANKEDKAELFKWQDKLRKLQDTLEKLTETLIPNARERLDEAEAKLGAAYQAFASLNAQLAIDSEELQAEIIEINKQMSGLNAQISAKRGQITKLETEAEDAMNNGYSDAATLIYQEIDSIQAEVDSLVDEVDGLASTRYSKTQELNQKKAEMDLLSPTLKAALDKATTEEAAAEGALYGAGGYLDQERATQSDIATAEYNIQKYSGIGGETWKQERVSDCCIEGQARELEDCTFGTCYICVDEYSGKFRAALHGKVWGQLISPATKMIPEDDPRKPFISGATIWPYLASKDTCVKFACGQTAYSDERVGRVQNTKYYEYCTGSILGCALSFQGIPKDGKAEYMQGFKYKVLLDDAGIYWTTDFYHWAKLGQYKGSDPREASCLYANQYGYLGGGDVGTFIDLVATHYVCNYAELWHECPPDAGPFCGVQVGLYYTPGNPSLQIKKLKREKDELVAYGKALRAAYAEVKSQELALAAEKEAKEQQLEEEHAQMQAKTNLLATLTTQIGALESEVQTLTGERDQLVEERDALEQARQDYVSNTLAPQRQVVEDLQQQIEELKYTIGVLTENRDSSRAYANDLYYQINELQDQRQALENSLETMVPGSAQYIQTETDIANLDTQIQGLQEERNQAVDAGLQYADQLDEAKKDLKEKEDALAIEQSKLTGYEGSGYQAVAVPVMDKQDEVDAKNLLLSQKVDSLNSKKVQKEALSDEIETLAINSGTYQYNEKLCPYNCMEADGSTYCGCTYGFQTNGGSVNGQPIGQDICCCSSSIVGSSKVCNYWYPPGGWEYSCGDTCQAIKNLVELIDNAKANKANLSSEHQTVCGEPLMNADGSDYGGGFGCTGGLVGEKNAEIARLSNEAGQIPAYLVGPVGKPSSLLLSEDDVKARIQEQVDLAKELEKKDPWVTGGFGAG